MGIVLEGALWAAAATGVWLLTLSSVTLPELVTAVATAVPCAVLAVAARRALERSWSAAPSWARWLLPLPAAVVADTVRVLGLAAGVLVGRRIPAGELRRVPVHRERRAGRWAARQAAVAGLVSAAPGSVVLDVDDDDGDGDGDEGGDGTASALLHALGSGRPRLEEAVRR
jgi:multisubunit Na+/H+ antiporter MnhE subunit